MITCFITEFTAEYERFRLTVHIYRLLLSRSCCENGEQVWYGPHANGNTPGGFCFSSKWRCGTIELRAVGIAVSVHQNLCLLLTWNVADHLMFFIIKVGEMVPTKSRTFLHVEIDGKIICHVVLVNLYLRWIFSASWLCAFGCFKLKKSSGLSFGSLKETREDP